VAVLPWSRPRPSANSGAAVPFFSRGAVARAFAVNGSGMRRCRQASRLGLGLRMEPDVGFHFPLRIGALPKFPIDTRQCEVGLGIAGVKASRSLKFVDGSVRLPGIFKNVAQLEVRDGKARLQANRLPQVSLGLAPLIQRAFRYRKVQVRPGVGMSGFRIEVN